MPEDYPGRLELDGRDDMAIHILGIDGDEAVATARLIFPEAGRLLPTEEAFELEIEPFRAGRGYGTGGSGAIT